MTEEVGTSVPTGALCVVGELGRCSQPGEEVKLTKGESLQPARSPQARKRTNKSLHAQVGEEGTIIIYIPAAVEAACTHR